MNVYTVTIKKLNFPNLDLGGPNSDVISEDIRYDSERHGSCSLVQAYIIVIQRNVMY